MTTRRSKATALSLVMVATASLTAGCSHHKGNSGTAGGPLNVSQQTSPLARSQILILDQIVSEVTGSSAPTGAQISASQSDSAQSGLSQLGATRNDQGIVITLPEKVLFDFDKSDLRGDAQPVLAQIAQVLGGYPTAQIRVHGFTDNKGSDAYNQGLSERRANAVKDALANRPNLNAGHLSAQGFGKANPVAANSNPDGSDNPAGRAQNRRVEVVILGA